MPAASPSVIVLGGPNGAGKTTVAPRLLRGTLRVQEFVNADTLAQGLSAFRPEEAAIEAGRIMLRRLNDLELRRISFAFESTLASHGLVRRLRRLQQGSYGVKVVYLWLPEVELAIQRVAQRVRAGGHDVSPGVVKRRFERGLYNFHTIYRRMADAWRLYDASTMRGPQLIASGGRGRPMRVRHAETWRRAAEGHTDV